MTGVGNARAEWVLMGDIATSSDRGRDEQPSDEPSVVRPPADESGTMIRENTRQPIKQEGNTKALFWLCCISDRLVVAQCI